MTNDSFGEYLKRERQMRGVSLDEICKATRISVRFLEALESEQWSALPGGVFNRGFVRAVARFLGLDEEDLVAQYAAATQEKVEAPMLLTPLAPPASKRSWAPAIIIGVLIVLAAGGWFGWRFLLARQAQMQAQDRASAATMAAAQTKLVKPPATPAAPPAANSTLTGDPSSSSGTSSAAVAGVADPLQLKLEAGKATTVTVTADGSKVFDGSIIAGQSRTFSAQTAFEVSAQDAGALLLELNGQTLAPIGPPGRPGKVTVTRRDLKLASGGAN